MKTRRIFSAIIFFQMSFALIIYIAHVKFIYSNEKVVLVKNDVTVNVIENVAMKVIEKPIEAIPIQNITEKPREAISIQNITNVTSLEQLHLKIWKEIEYLQEEGDCESKKILFCDNRNNYAGLGSMVHRYGACMQIAYGLGRIWFINQRQYDNFGGLTKYLQPESRKCNYLKEKYKSFEGTVDIENVNSYLANGYDVNNEHKVMRYSSVGNFPHPRHIPTTLPNSIEKILLSFHIRQPWLWFTSQFLGYLLLRPNKDLQEIIQKINLTSPYIAMHIRRGDKITSGEAKIVDEHLYLQNAQNYFNKNFTNHTEKLIYLASDDKNMKNRIENIATKDYHIKTQQIASNNSKFQLENNGRMILDLYFLAYSNYTICTFSSNIGRLIYELKENIPPYNAYHRTISMDEPKDMVYLWNGYANYWIRHFYRTIGSNNNERDIIGHRLLKYKENRLIDFNNVTYTYRENGTEVVLGHVYTRENGKNIDGYVFIEHFMKWPGRPKYFFN